MRNILVLMSTYNGEKYLKEQIDSIEGINALPVAMKLSNRYGVEFSFISAADVVHLI